jgi:hypothetical protein
MVDRDDVGAQPQEAEAQRVETVMPWIWGAIGLVVIAGFVAWTLATAGSGHRPANPPAAAPLFKSSGGY